LARADSPSAYPLFDGIVLFRTKIWPRSAGPPNFEKNQNATFMKSWLKRLYPRLPVVKQLLQIQATLKTANLIQLNYFFRHELAVSPRYRDPRKLNHHEHQVFSQHGEDGIIAEIFRRIGSKSRVFVEFGVGDGLENNTAFWLSQGWRGFWIEGDVQSAGLIQKRFHKPLNDGSLTFLQSFITAENIDSLFNQMKVPEEFDLLSLDIDRNTFHVWKALSHFQPRVVVVEYNATFPADVDWVADYDACRMWNNTAYFGASLKAFERLAADLGYILVSCDFSGVNAFFVKQTECLDLFADPFTSENHYEPPRYWAARRDAHSRCFDDRFHD
jgi:hypothetical protein